MSHATEGYWGTLLRALLVRRPALLPLPFLNSIVTRDRDIYCFIVKEIKTVKGLDLKETLQRNQKDCLALARVCGFKGLSKYFGGECGETCTILFLVLSNAVGCAGHKCRACLEQRKLAPCRASEMGTHPILSSPHTHHRIKACP